MAADLRLQVLLSTIDKATKPLRAIMAGSKGTASALKAARDRLRELDNTQKNIGAFRELHAGMRQTQTDLHAAQQRVSALAAEIKAAGAPTKQLTKDFDKATAQARELGQQHQAQTYQFQALRNSLNAAGVSTSKLREAQRRLRTETLAANTALAQQKARLAALAKAQQRMQKMHRAGQSAALHGAGALVAGQQMARGVAAPMAAFANQEDAAAQLRASMMTAGGEVAPEFAEIDALAQKLGNRLPGTTAELLEMMTMLRRQGMSAKSILGGLGEATATLGAQLRMPYTEAAEFAAKLQDATRTTEGDMLALSDTIQRTFYLGVDADNMLQGFSKLSPALDTIKLSGLEATHALAPLLVMADQAGMAGEAAGNAYRKVLQGALDAKKIGKANAALKGSGIKLDFTDGQGEFGGMAQMFAQLDQLKGLDTQKRLAVIKKMFGDDAETLQVVSLLINKGANGYAEVQAKMAAQASLQARVNAQLGTLRNLWEATTGTFTNVLAAIGEAIAPELKALVEWLGKVAAKAQAWAKENPRLAGGLLKTAAVLIGLVVVVGGLALVVGTLMMPFAGLQFALTTAGPLFSTVAGGIGWLAPMLLNLGARVLPLVGQGILWLGRALLMNPIGLTLTAIAGAIYLVWKYWAPILAWATDAIEWLANTVGAAWERIKHYFSGALTAIAGLFNGDPGQVLAGLTTMFTAVDALLGGLPAKFMQFGADMLRGLIAGIGSMAGAVKDAVVDAASGAAGWFAEKLGIHSPSRVFAGFGQNTMQGLAQGLTGSQGEPLKAVGAMAGRMRQLGTGMALGAAALPAAAFDARPPIAPGGAQSAAAAPMTVNITINAAPGSDAGAIAKAVRAELDKLERERSRRRNARLSDLE